MGFAAAGLLPAVWGAILQEVIDVAVILNALRALRSGPAEARLGRQDSVLTRRFQEEHLAIRSDIDRLQAVAEALDGLDPETALVQVRDVHRMLVDEVQPHEDAEEQVLYPSLGRYFGGSDPMATMSRAHIEITHQIRSLGQTSGRHRSSRDGRRGRHGGSQPALWTPRHPQAPHRPGGRELPLARRRQERTPEDGTCPMSLCDDMRSLTR